MSQKIIKIVLLGDIVARPGRNILRQRVPELKQKYQYDLLVANGENSAGGRGITPETAKEIFSAGVDLITLGDHTFDAKDISPYLDSQKDKVIRPANFKTEFGRGYTIWTHPSSGTKVAVINLIGRVFMNGLYDCPFQTADQLINNQLKECQIKIVDFHAEATSEKYALGHYLDGRISLLVGTHTHVPTADQKILPNGTGYLTDLGMTGSYDHVIGCQKEVSIQRFISTGKGYKPGEGDEHLSGVYAEIDLNEFKCTKIERVWL